MLDDFLQDAPTLATSQSSRASIQHIQELVDADKLGEARDYAYSEKLLANDTEYVTLLNTFLEITRPR